MKVLSTRLAMRDGYLPEQFRRTIIEWLKAGPPSKEVGERYETEEITTKPIILKAGYCTLEPFILKRPDATYEACKLTHIYREQTWVTEAILKTTPQSESKVYINIDCLGDTTGFDEIPTVRTEIIRAFVKDGWLKEDILPISAEPIMLTGAEVNVVVDAINGSYRGVCHWSLSPSISIRQGMRSMFNGSQKTLRESASWWQNRMITILRN